jgi:DNA invertase Pin-like site-specific DNA recombinase
MLKRRFDYKQHYRVVVYLRMSSDKQNPRSPDQQLAEIKKVLKSLGLDWQIVKEYRDAGISGRYKRKRIAYQQMLRDIKTGKIVADLILVDTLERFGRVDDLPTIRKELREKHGVLVLTADSHFADPNTPQGRALGAIESIRATEDGFAKAHNVNRGKRDAVLLKHWPGGEPPLGYRVKCVMKVENQRDVLDHALLVPDPAASWIIELLFQKAADTGWGTIRLAGFLNQHPEIPAKFKPFQPETIGYRLDNRIYYGELVWNANSTGIVDDTRVVEKNRDEEIRRVPDFCEPIVSRELWERVQALRELRRRRHPGKNGRQTGGNGKLIQPLAPGMALKYLLSGLLYCGTCGLRMTASSTGVYITKSGEQRRYVSYVCPGYLGRHCINDTHVAEPWIREVVIAQLRKRLFPDS